MPEIPKTFGCFWQLIIITIIIIFLIQGFWSRQAKA